MILVAPQGASHLSPQAPSGQWSIPVDGGVHRPSHRDMLDGQRQRDHGRGHHLGRHERCPGPAWHPHPPRASWTAARRAPGRRRLHLPDPPGTSRPRTPRHHQRAASRQPHQPAPPMRGLRPGRLPHRLRPPPSHLPTRPDQPGLARPLPDLLAHRRAPDRGAVHPEPVPAVPGPTPVHQGPRQERGLSSTRTPRPADPHPSRAADTRMEDTLRGPIQRGGHRQRVRPRPRHAPLPLPRSAESPPVARTHGHRSEHRTPQQPAGSRGTLLPETTDRLPDLPGSARHPPVAVLAHPRQLTTNTKIADRVKLVQCRVNP